MALSKKQISVLKRSFQLKTQQRSNTDWYKPPSHIIAFCKNMILGIFDHSFKKNYFTPWKVPFSLLKTNYSETEPKATPKDYYQGQMVTKATENVTKIG